MATILPFAYTTPQLRSHNRCVIFRPSHGRNIFKFRCKGENSTSNSNSTTRGDTEPENVLLKMAWYSSELLGIAASFLRSPSKVEAPDRGSELVGDGLGVVDRGMVVETIKEDFQRSYFVTGNLTLNAYEEDCEFADPAGSFKGLRRFKRNCTNFGSLLEKSNMKLTKWEDFEDKGIGHWRFSCILFFPWKPILSGMWSTGMFLKWPY
ncbi:uncharacterized protein LOC132298970 isoform X2 [Cornus florida]|uniref:uncharacterized protein LOC132298970 isoform X2 n=1 Tax=Cornus florida TaxID=4283 RepID=UPI00289EA640|nr:uncharacterized protein LOC132298970 isoform X2 [Cornus florida]